MKILCATNMPFAAEALGTLGAVTVKEGRAIGPADTRDATVLAIRSTTKVTEAMLAGSALRFVGTATIGTDHLDIPALERHGIRWCYAPGCNADSVAEYVMAALLHVAVQHGLSLTGKTLGVIGVGNVGSRVAARAAALGLRVLLNDPPRARAARGPGATAPFVTLQALLAAADIVTLHVPLTRDGEDATWHLANRTFFERLKPGAIFINSARGPVVHTTALLQALDSGVVAHAVIDTWEGEPAYRPDLLPRVDLATPHIAGYSYDGRVNGTVMVYREACRCLGVDPAWRVDALLPEPPMPRVELDTTGLSREQALHALVRQVYDIAADDARMRAAHVADDTARAAAFDRLRKTYPERREFPHTRARLRGAGPDLLAAAHTLGFRLADPAPER